MVMKRLSVVRYNVLVCNAEEFAKAVSEVEDLIISTIEKVYGDYHYVWFHGDRFIKPSFTELFSNPVVGGVTAETPRVKPRPKGREGGHCRKYRIIGNKPSLSRVVVKCNEGTFILRLRPFSYNCTGWLAKQLAIVGIDVRVKSYAYKFATFVKELAKAVESNPTQLRLFVDGYVGSNP